MNSLQNAFASARFNRLMFWLGVAILATGMVALLIKVMPGSDNTSFGADQGFRPTLPEHQIPLKNTHGLTIRTFWQLDPKVRTTIRTFLASAVARKHQGDSWAVVAPSLKQGYTRARWSHADALPVVPYQIENVDQTQYYLDYASTQEILIEVGVSAKNGLGIRPTSFQLGLSPVGRGANKQWLVDYWMPRWTPPLPVN
jgi:hypothetical protein